MNFSLGAYYPTLRNLDTRNGIQSGSMAVPNSKLHGKRPTERRLFRQPWRVHFVCVFSICCALVPFFDSEILRQTTLFFQFLLVRLYFSCFTCVAGLESNFYRHHLHLSTVSTFCTAIVKAGPKFPFIGSYLQKCRE